MLCSIRCPYRREIPGRTWKLLREQGPGLCSTNLVLICTVNLFSKKK
jgi:hypothetical protein